MSAARSSGIGIRAKALTFVPPVLPAGTQSREKSSAAMSLEAWPAISRRLRLRHPASNIAQ